MGPYLGDYNEDATLDFIWDSNDSSGGSITRATDGTISVYKANGIAQSVAGITDTEDFDGVTGIHHLRIDLNADAFYAIANDYNVVLSAATIDGQTVNAVLCSFSIENRFAEVDVTKWLGQAVTLSDNNNPDVNINEISDDLTAPQNLELQYDATGLAGDTFPATQSQLAGIANVGSAVNITPDSYTLATGTQSSGTVANVAALDGTNHEHTDATFEMDLYYEFKIGSGIPTSFTVTGYLNGNNDDLEVYGYDWVASAWVRIGTLAGKNAATNEVNSYEMFVNMVGSGANEGVVRVRFTDGAFTLSTATLAIDQIFLSFSRGNEGYEKGAVWLDTTAPANTNTVVGIDGVARNPVTTIAAANTLLASTNLNNIEVAPGSSFTLAASQDNQVFNGINWTLALGGQSVSATHIIGAAVTGICTGATPPTFENCHLGAVTLPPCHLENCTFEGTITLGSAGDFDFDSCESGIPGSGSPVVDFGAALNASNIGIRDYSGGIHIHNMGAGAGTYLMTLEGDGQLIINANCSVTSSLSLRGNFLVTDNASGAVVVTRDDDSANIILALADTNEMQGKLPTNNIMGSSVVTDKDDEIDAIKAVTDNLPNSGALTDIDTGVNAIEAKLPTNEIMGSSDKSDKDDEIDAIKAKTDNLPEAPQKNVALSDLSFLMVDETDFATPETGLTVTGQVSKDGAAFGAIAGSIAEISNGIYSCDAAQADMNADLLIFRFSASGAADTFITIKTTT